MTVEFEYGDVTVKANVTHHGHDDRDPRAAISDDRYEVEWIDDGGISDLRNLDGWAIAEFLERSK